MPFDELFPELVEFEALDVLEGFADPELEEPREDLSPFRYSELLVTNLQNSMIAIVSQKSYRRKKTVKSRCVSSAKILDSTCWTYGVLRKHKKRCSKESK